MFLQLFIDIEGGLKKALAKWGLRKLQVCCFLAVSFHVSVRASINKNQSLAVYCGLAYRVAVILPGVSAQYFFGGNKLAAIFDFYGSERLYQGGNQDSKEGEGRKQKSCLISPTSSTIHSYTKSNLASQISDCDLVMLSHPNKISPCRLIVIMSS